MNSPSDKNHEHTVIEAIYFYSNQQYATIVKNYIENRAIMVDVDLDLCITDQWRRESIVDFDYVISDYDLQETTGMNILRNIRLDCPNMPFILLDDKGNIKRGLDAIGAGATAYLEKGNGELTLEEIADKMDLEYRCENKR